MALALLIALIRSTAWPDEPATEIQAALDWQRRLDMFDIECQGCGGLGVVADLANRFYRCPGLCPREEYEPPFDERCSSCEMVYGGKRCPECDGLGSVRG